MINQHSYNRKIFYLYTIINTYSDKCSRLSNTGTQLPFKDLDNLCTFWASSFSTTDISYNLDTIYAELRLASSYHASCLLYTLQHFIQHLNIFQNIFTNT